jgi:hypothetical protein
MIEGFGSRLRAERVAEIGPMGARLVLPGGVGEGFADFLGRVLNGGEGRVRGVDLFRGRDGKVAEKLSYVKG